MVLVACEWRTRAVVSGPMTQRQQSPASNQEWRQWGESDPFWGVASWPGREQGGQNPWTPEEFYDLGASDWSDFFAHWSRYGVSAGTCVEIGCGAGRLSNSIASDFGKVIGVDVAEGMLETARRHVSKPNVAFKLGTGVGLPVEPGTVDGVFSAQVFQHFDSLAVAKANFVAIYDALAPGGSMMIHLPVYIAPIGVPFVEPAVKLRERIADVRATRMRRRGTPLMKGLRFSWASATIDKRTSGWIQHTLVDQLGFTDLELSIFALRSNGDYHPCVLARKPGD